MNKLGERESFRIPTIAMAGPFDGPYIGAYAGYGSAEDKGIGHGQSSGAVNGWTHKPEPKGAIFGLMGGYNWSLGNGFVLGVEADLEGRGNSSDRVNQKDDGVSDPEFQVVSKIQAATSLRGRLGYAIGKQTLVFATAGYAVASVKRTWHDMPAEKESHTDMQGGWTAGLGADYAFGERLSARFEVRHTDYGTKKVDANLWGEFYKQKLSEDSIRIGLNYTF
ncbi:MAG: outer rane immunogenic protein [Pseudomonadota bacterium]|nr:outer rane immunogenic protein [Pseudomonadota bacterium]MDQ5918053.1 outer rane immunogenic protein [Pseudomonadota bacterium]MDQ5944741.1 outer rane immunogenic protein [Pseudomonadota bacterium]